MAPPLFGAEFIRRRQKRRKKARLSKMPSQPARDKGCGTQRLDTHNAACGIDSKTALRVLSVTQSRFVCKKRTAILTMRRTDVRIEIQKGTA